MCQGYPTLFLGCQNRAELRRFLSLSVKQKTPHIVDNKAVMVFISQFYPAMSHAHANALVKARHNIGWEK